MSLSSMRYKDYVWPHNPRVYEIAFERKIAVYKIPFGTYAMQDLGLAHRVLRGEGEFAGEGAYAQFRKLAAYFYEGGAGILVHPVWQSSNAYFVALSLRQEPREDYVSYAFEFWEDRGVKSTGLIAVSASETVSSDASGAVKAGGTYTVVSGDTMWAIANEYGLTLSELVGLNPQIKNPNLIYPGDIINVS